MPKRISKERMREIRAGVADYIAKLERGEIPGEVKPAGIAFAPLVDEKPRVQPSQQPSAGEGNSEDKPKS